MLTFWAVLKASIFINKPLWSSFGQLLEILGDLIFRRLVTLQFRVTHLLVVINLLRRQSGLSISFTLLHLTLHFVSNFKVCNEATRWRSKAAFRRRLSQRNWRTAFFLLLGRGRLALGGRRARPRRLVRIWGHLRGGRFEKMCQPWTPFHWFSSILTMHSTGFELESLKGTDILTSMVRSSMFLNEKSRWIPFTSVTWNFISSTF